MDIIFAAFFQAASVTLDKAILSRKVNFRGYLGISFPLSFFITLIIYLIFRPAFSSAVLTGMMFAWLAISILLTILINLVAYKAMEFDYLSEIETIGLLAALPTVIFSSIIFSDERNYFVLVPAVVATLAIFWSHVEKGHVFFKTNTTPFLICTLVLTPLNAVVMKILLAGWNPITLELIRNGVVAAIFAPLFQKNIRGIKFSPMLMLIATNLLTSIAWILFFFSYQRIGIVYTVLLFSLQPILVYLGAVLILKEKPNRKKIIAFAIVIASIAIAQFSSRA